MTTVKITKDYITVEGHSDYDVMSKDIICASISTMCNYLQALDNLDYIEKDGYYRFNLKKASDYNIKVFKDLATQLSKQYPDNIKIERWYRWLVKEQR